MQIVHVMDHSFPQGDGYSVRAKYMIEAQVATGHKITVLTSPSQGFESNDLVAAGVQYRRIHYSKWERKMVALGGKHMIFGRAIRRGLSRLLDHDHFEVVHAHTPFTVAAPALAEARKRGIPFVYEKRNLWEESARARGKPSGRWPFYSLAKLLDQRVTLRADAICTITNALKTKTIAMGVETDRIFVVGNGVDTTEFAPMVCSSALRARCVGSGDFVIGFVGSFFSFEGLPLLVQAFATVQRCHHGARLVLVGDGEDRALVERTIAELGLADFVTVTGRVPHAEVSDFYAAMDVLVYPRYRSALTETISPLKPLEPMAMGRCVIGSDVGGIMELVTDGLTGLIFKAGSVPDLASKLNDLISKKIDVALMGGNARAYVHANRQWQAMSALYELAYARAIAGRQLDL